MRIEVLTIGDELLDGRVADTNTLRLAQALSTVGYHISQRTSVTDDLPAIISQAQAIAARQTKLCIVSGGLGPTSDDITAPAFAELLGTTLVRDAEQAAKITQRLQKRGRVVAANQLKQADRPHGAEMIANPVGTAPGFAVVFQGCRFVAVPGVPQEFDTMVHTAVVQPLQAQKAPILRRALYCTGILEAAADERLATLPNRWPAVRLQFRVKFPDVHVTMHAQQEHQKEISEAFAFAQHALAEHVYSFSEEGLPKAVLQILRHRKETVATAESCTGGLVASLITDEPSSSDVFSMGMVTYSDTAKHQLLNVPMASLAQYGAVSEQVVTHMAQGVRTVAGSTWGIAVSGLAGPTGGTPEQPVGTIWLGLAGPQGVQTRRLSLPFSRQQNKLAAAYAGLDMLRQVTTA